MTHTMYKKNPSKLHVQYYRTNPNQLNFIEIQKKPQAILFCFGQISTVSKKKNHHELLPHDLMGHWVAQYFQFAFHRPQLPLHASSAKRNCQ